MEAPSAPRTLDKELQEHNTNPLLGEVLGQGGLRERVLLSGAVVGRADTAVRPPAQVPEAEAVDAAALHTVAPARLPTLRRVPPLLVVAVEGAVVRRPRLEHEGTCPPGQVLLREVVPDGLRVLRGVSLRLAAGSLVAAVTPHPRSTRQEEEPAAEDNPALRPCLLPDVEARAALVGFGRGAPAAHPRPLPEAR